MLLLTDTPAQSLRLKQTFGALQNCTMVTLGDACRRPAVHPMIACHVGFGGGEVGEPAPQSLIGAALSHHRTDDHMPVLFLVRDMTPDCAAQAEALGATEVLPDSASREQLHFWVKRCRMSQRDRIYGRSPTDQSTSKNPLYEAVESVGNSLLDLLNAARQSRALPITTLERGADTLIASVKRTSIREWLDVVRRYDDATYQHCLLVAGLVASFALRLGLSPASQHLLAQAALIHDIGKAAVPQTILNKAGPLAPAERDVMRKHAADGHAMLVAQGGIHPGILDIVRHHHELLDGSGYPDGLRAGQITDLVRLTTICDIYAALIERRPYKGAMAPEDAREVLVAMGNKLDGVLLRAFDDVIRDC